MPTQTQERAPSSGGRLVAADGRTLPLRAMRLAAEAGGGLARTRLEQRFQNPYPDPLTVTYQLPLPADGALAAFAFRIGERRIEGQIDRRETARERFEEALAEGRSAALLEQDRPSLFTQELGNVPPGAEIVAELTVDQPLAWVEGGEWEWRFPTTVAPRYSGAPGRVEDAQKLTVDVAEAELPARLELELSIDERLASGAPSSTSHDLAVEQDGERTAVHLAAGRARLDRDVVVRWPVAIHGVGARLITARPAADRPHAGSAYGLLTLVPPAEAREEETLPRDLIVLIDTSGSMTGPPLEQAQAVVSELVRSLGERDRLELVEFSFEPRRWRKRPARMDTRGRAEALEWIAGLEAGGGTEMRRAVVEALRPLDGGGQRQVVLISDGHIGFEREIVGQVLEDLPPACRLHTLGVGSAPNRCLTSAAARAGRGVEAIVGLDEDPAAAARRLVASTRAPRVVELALSGSALLECAPERSPDLFDGAPARVSLALSPDGGALVVRGRSEGGSWRYELPVPATDAGQGRQEVVSRFGRERVEDLEMRAAAGAAGEALDGEIEELGLRFELATRRTSWVAVSSEPTVDPRQPARRERIPHELPHGMSVEGLGLRGTHAISLGQLSRFASSEETGMFLPGAVRGDRELADRAIRLRGAGSPSEAPGAPATVLEGRILVYRDGVLVVELEPDGEDWTLPEEVRVFWRRWAAWTARIDAAQSTRSGPIAAGQRVRLRLLLPENARPGRPRRLRFEVDGRELEVVLH